jgi:serine-type D-Ala-D-Ala carboxypeptidase/endopeptidase (penicillin-binding protein 4)
MAKNRNISIIIIGLICLAVLTWRAARADGPQAAGPLERALAAKTGRRDAVMVAAPGGDILAAVHPDRALVPASILKLVTTLAALKELGPGFRFRTDFFIDSQNNLKIKGFGDPLLISERLQVIAAVLAGRRPSIRDLILDDSYFSQPVRIPGRGASPEPYDAPNGALCVNFNTVSFNRRNGSWVSGEPQTPLLPSVIARIAESGLSKGRITLAANSAEALQYSGELFSYFLRQAGVTVQGEIRRGRVDPERDQLIWSYQSQDTLRGVVTNLLEFSNNFIANQILLVLGAEELGPPATMGKGLDVVRTYFHKTLEIADGRIVEGSGISRDNRVTARAMLKVLQAYEPHHALLRHEGRQFYKTGHLKGIRTRAGFLTCAQGGLYHFVIMVNTPGKSTDEIMRTIEKYLK